MLISRAKIQESDPILGGFLNLLASDLTHNPERLTALDSHLVGRAKTLVSDVNVDLDRALLDEDD